MQPFDLVIRGGTVATATDSFKADVGIRGSAIAAIGEDHVERIIHHGAAFGILVILVHHGLQAHADVLCGK